MKNKNYVNLSIDDNTIEDIPLKEYPRPQFQRESYISLNGIWDFHESKKEELPSEYDEKIIVPFSPESSLSRINRTIDSKHYIFYKKEFTLDKDFIKGQVILHFDAIDEYSTIYLNEKEIFFNKGGYLPFEINITEYLMETNTLIIKEFDPIDLVEPYGKQRKKRGGMWYTKISGIWKSVWLESIPTIHINSFKLNSSLNSISIKVDTPIKKKKIVIHTQDNEIIREFTKDEISIIIPNAINWTPNNPYLYYFDLYAGEDKVSSYFALRTLEIKKYKDYKVFHLNDRPFYFHGVLDQGYFPDGIYTPKTYKYYEDDILRMKELGFNTLRKHIKIEPLYFYYLCDKLGMVVFQDMVNNSKYHYIRDTVIPTIGYKKFNDTHFRVKKKNKDAFIKTMEGTVELLYNSPSICLWTIFNEGWGQFDSENVLKHFNSLDTSRFVDLTSGWFDYKKANPINSQHIYFFPKQYEPYDNRPVFLSEFGGYELTIKDHVFNLDKVYGYKHFTSKETLQEGLNELYKEFVLPKLKEGLCASIYTQLSDVEDETNGLYTYDRKVCKIIKEDMKKISDKLKL